MASFDSKSRHAKAETWQVPDAHGRTVTVVAPAEPQDGDQELLGYHQRKGAHRLDVLAGRYLRSPTEWWRICDQAGVVIPEALSLALEIPIPKKGS
jgi:hypothetical protein